MIHEVGFGGIHFGKRESDRQRQQRNRERTHSEKGGQQTGANHVINLFIVYLENRESTDAVSQITNWEWEGETRETIQRGVA